MSKRDIILIGAGGHAHSCIDVIEQQGQYHIAGLVGMAEEMHDNHLGYQVIATDDDLPQLVKQFKHALVTVGQIKSPDRRVQLFQRLAGLGFTMPIVISPLAYVSRHAVVGNGTIVMHGALINAGARVGINCIINTNALVEHDATVGNHCHISTGSIINGGTIIQQKTFIGSNAMISNNIEIGENNIVRGGGVVVRPLPSNQDH
jgi:sugar O-acyltransferase (sialic acid O-acetyltransferase NeuD family)